MTSWPGFELPLPQKRLRVQFHLDGDVLRPARPVGEHMVLEQAGHEAYLRVSELDLDNASRIVDFANDFGTLGVRADGYAAFAAKPEFSEKVRPRLERSLPPSAREILRNGASKATPADLEEFPWLETLEEFRWGATLLRDLIGAWRMIREGRDHVGESSVWSGGDAQDVALFLSEWLTAGLRGFHPAIIPAAQRDDAVPVPVFGPEPRWCQPGLPMFQRACLELHNHIASNAGYRTCASEGCGRVFVHQDGNAGHRGPKSRGVKYCSPACKNAQAQRMRRARLRKQQVG